MTYAENLWLFFLLLFGIIIVPGMDMLFVLTNALTRGRPAGLSAEPRSGLKLQLVGQLEDRARTASEARGIRRRAKKNSGPCKQRAARKDRVFLFRNQRKTIENFFDEIAPAGFLDLSRRR